MREKTMNTLIRTRVVLRIACLCLSSLPCLLNAQDVDVITFNLRVDVDGGERAWDARKGACIALVQTKSPDFVGVQESAPNQTGDMDAALPEFWQFGRGRESNGGGEGCQIFYEHERWELDANDSGTFQLSPTPDVWGSNGWNFGWPRICTWGRFREKSTGRYVYMYNTHFPLDGGGRTDCAGLIAERIASRAHPDDPVVLTGDMNAGESETCILIFKGQNASPITMLDSYRALYPDETMVGTYSGWASGPLSGAKIDYVFTMGHTSVLEAEILYPQPGRIVSDHFPVRGKMRFGTITTPHITIANRQRIIEALEDGKTITVTLLNDRFVVSLDEANWNVENLPHGVSVGRISRIDDTHVSLILAGNSTPGAYSEDITDVTVTVAAEECMDATGNLSANTGVILSRGPTHLPGLLQAEAYADMYGVRKEPCADSGGGENVGYLDAGDWVEYDVAILEAGAYDIKFRIASQSTAGQFQLLSDDLELLTQDVPVTGGWQDWETITTQVDLAAGTQNLKIQILTAGFNINWIDFALDVTNTFSTNNISSIRHPLITFDRTSNLVVFECMDFIDEVTLVSFNGRTVMKESGSSLTSLNVGSLPGGIYHLRIRNRHGKYAGTKIVIF